MGSSVIMRILIFLAVVLLYFYIIYKSCENLTFGITWIINVVFMLASYLISAGNVDIVPIVIAYCISSFIQVYIFYKISNSTNSFLNFFILSVVVYFVIGLILYFIGAAIDYDILHKIGIKY